MVGDKYYGASGIDEFKTLGSEELLGELEGVSSEPELGSGVIQCPGSVI